jgi:hypothetical protein
MEVGCDYGVRRHLTEEKSAGEPDCRHEWRPHDSGATRTSRGSGDPPYKGTLKRMLKMDRKQPLPCTVAARKDTRDRRWRAGLETGAT